MQVAVLPSKHDSIVDGPDFVLRVVPPRTYLLRVRAADRQFHSAAFQVTAAAGRAIVQHVELENPA